MDAVREAPATETVTLTVTWDDKGMHVLMDGAITRDHLIIAGFTVSQLAAAMQAQAIERKGPALVTAPAMPGLRRRE